jgi:ubiquinone biosynthesis protein
MLDTSAFEACLSHLTPSQRRAAIAELLPEESSHAERVSAVEAVLCGPLGKFLRETMARWIVDELVPVEKLVPKPYLNWRPPVRDAMVFVVSHLSPARLAPKLVEQLELSETTPSEERLLRLIAKVPGLQKLGQVIARNRHLSPVLRNALASLENGIRDSKAEEIIAIIKKELGQRLKKYSVEIAPTIVSEASVAAVIRFTWREPGSKQRQRGVFKVLKPHIPAFFAEDLDYLHGLTQYFRERHHRYGFPARLIPDTFRKVQRLLGNEVDFVREQRTLSEASNLYSGIVGVRVPRVIQPLCTRTITALSEERGVKVPNATARMSHEQRRKVAQQLIEALVAVPLLTANEHAVFHGDPHAGNLLYNKQTGDLVILDWALRERLSREQRRHLALLFLMVSLRDPDGTYHEILSLSQQVIRPAARQAKVIQQTIRSFLEELAVVPLADGVEAMHLLERIALEGLKFPAPLIMLSKMMFTLDGILHDIGGEGRAFSVAAHIVRHWITHREAFRSPLKAQDWITLQLSALLYVSRLWLKGEEIVVEQLLPAGTMPSIVRH